jgi:hypothetical protein
VRLDGRGGNTEPTSLMGEAREVISPISDRDVPMEDGPRGREIRVHCLIPPPTLGNARTTYPAPPPPQQPTLAPPHQTLPPPTNLPSYNPFSFHTPGFQQFFTPRDFGTRRESSSPAEHGLFYRPPPSPSPLSRFPRITQTVKTDPLSLVYRTIYAIESEQEKLVFSDGKTLFEANDSSGRRTGRTETKRERLVCSPVRTIFEMSDFVKAEKASKGPDQMT